MKQKRLFSHPPEGGGKKKRFIFLLAALCLLTGCGGAAPAEITGATPEASETVTVTGHMALHYAEQFSVDEYSDGSALITIAGTDRFLAVPADWDGTADCPVIRTPVQGVYLAASSAMDLFSQLEALSAVRFTSTAANNWALPEVREALAAEEMAYAGKYSAPDFELLLSEGCPLAVESTMIYHSPDIKEKLESLGIPVLVERSSYETHPLGRVEWIKLYGLLLGCAAEAEEFFDAQARLLSELDTLPAAGQTVAFFHISTAGAAVVRKPGDYVSKMIELSGGTYVFSDLPGSGDNALSTMNMQMESFYAGARDADVLIYNGTIDGQLETVDQLLQKSSLFADFKAVQTGDVWCTEQSLFQKSSAAAGMIRDFNAVLSGTAEDQMTFLHRLN